MLTDRSVDSVPFGPSRRVWAAHAEGMPALEVTPAARTVAARPGSADRAFDAQRWASNRRLYIDNLKVLLIAAIIAGHGVGGYTVIEAWGYADVREVTLSPVTEAALLALVMPFGLVMIPLLFLVAGLLTPSSVRRKGTSAYIWDRVVRLGVPFAVFSVVVWPAILYALYRPLGNAPGSYWAELVGTSQEALDTGYLWFVGDLLIFSVAYAVANRLLHARPRNRDAGPITLSHLLGLAAVVGIATFFVRLAFPFDSQRYLDLNFYQWPECVALFALGVAAARRGWLDVVPARLRRQSRTATLAAAGGFVAMVVWGAVAGDFEEDVWRGGWHVEALMMAVLESVLAVFGPIWVLGVSQHRLRDRLRWAPPRIARSAYGAFILQGLVLIGLAVVLRPLPLVAEVKAIIVAAGGVAGSFALAALLIRRLPGIARIL